MHNILAKRSAHAQEIKSHDFSAEDKQTQRHIWSLFSTRSKN
jgi:hypothetical protein